MPLTLNDTIELLKAILEECGIEYIMLIISLIVVDWTVLFPSFNAIKTTESPSIYPSFLALFMRILTKYIKKFLVNPRFFPFHSAFNPSYFCLLRGWKVPLEPLFLASRGVFLLLSLQKNNPAFLVIFAWVMWFSVDNGDWLFRG